MCNSDKTTDIYHPTFVTSAEGFSMRQLTVYVA